jgi:hypothetical protein
MLRLRNRRGAVSPWFGILGLFIAFALVFGFWILPAINKVNRIHNFLGTNRGPESTWTGFMGRWESNNKFHREQYTKIACSLWKLENPAEAAQMRPGDPCPPPGPGTRPPGGPTYP